MKKLLLILVSALGLTRMVHADSKLSALTRDTTAQANDLFYKVDGTTSRAITFANLLSAGATYFIGPTAQYVSSVTANSPLSASTSGTAGSTVTISISNNLPGGSTSYVGSTALYISSITTNASLNETFTGTSGATVTLSVNVSSISLPNSGVTSGSYTNTNLTVDSHGLITAASNGTGSSGGGYAVEPATVTFQLNKGFISSTGTYTSLSPGVMHIVSVTSNVATGLVSLSTEVTGTLPLTNLVSSVTVAGILTAGSNITITPGSGITTIAATSSGVSVYPATATIITPFGINTSTIVVNSGTALGINSGTDRARFRMGGILSLQNVNSDNLTSVDSAGIFTTVASTQGVAFYTARTSSGTTASPSATQSGQVLLQVSAGGYGTTGWGSSSSGRMDFMADENFTDSSMATSWLLKTTPSGSLTPITRIGVSGAGSVDFYSSSTFHGPTTSTTSMTANSFTATGITSGQCVQTGTGGLLQGTGSACGSGGGGVSVYPATATIVATTAGISASTVTVSSLTITAQTNGIFSLVFDAAQAKLPGSAAPFISNSTGEFSASVYFDDTSTQSATWSGWVQNYDGRALYADLVFATTNTANFVCWNVYTATNTPNSSTNNYDSSTFNAAVSTAIRVNANQLALSKATVQLSNTTTTNGDFLTIKVDRQTGGCSNTNAVGFGRLKKVRIYE